MATLKSTTLSDGTGTTLHLTDNTRSGANKPSSTGNKLYANTTSLYWEDSDLVGGGGGGAADKSTAGNAVSNSTSSDSGATQGYRMAPGSSTTIGVTAKANTFMHGTFFNELVVMGDVEAPGLYIRGEGTDNSQSITEQGPTAHTLTVANDTKYENTVKLPWATTSIYFDGTGDKITAAQHKDFQFTERGDYTVELWVQHSDHAGTEVYIEFWEDASNYWQLQHVHGTGLQFSVVSASLTNFSMDGTEIADTLWHHVAAVKVGGQCVMYLDGVQVGQVKLNGEIDTLAGTLQIGDSGAGSEAFQGYMAEIRLTKGMARYTENFVPPQGYLSARMASFAIDATAFHSTDSPSTLDIGSRDRLGDDTLGDGHCQVTFKDNYTINSTAYMIPIEFKNTSDHGWSLNTNIWPRAVSNTYMLESDSVAVFSASAYYGDRAIWAGGQSGTPLTWYNTIDYRAISSTGNAVDFGDLSQTRSQVDAASNGSRGVFTGGYIPPNNFSDTLDYITIASTGNAADFGNLSAGTLGSGASGDGNRGISTGGSIPASTNVIDYFTISVTSNAKDFGDRTAAKAYMGCASNGSRVLSAHGGVNTIDYITVGTTGNAINFGDTYIITGEAGATDDGSRGMIGIGGNSPPPATTNILQYCNIGALGDSVDFGDLTAVRVSCTGAQSNGSRGTVGGGLTTPTSPETGINNIDYFPIGIVGTNAVDYGDLSQARRHNAGCSGD